MTIISPDEVVSGLVKSVREQIGHLLSDLPESNLKAVIQDIQSGVRPDFPYITVSLEEDDEQSGGWMRHKTTDSENNVHTIIEENLSIRITCYGDSASSILSNLRMLCTDDWSRARMSELTNATFVDYSTIFREPKYLDTDFINTAYIIANFTTVSDLTTDTGIIEKVTGEGRYLHFEGDENPIIDEFNIPS